MTPAPDNGKRILVIPLVSKGFAFDSYSVLDPQLADVLLV
jgi:hypothetical protein